MKQFTDQLGTIHAFENTPKRIISLVPSQTELLYDLGLEDAIVGITKFCVHPFHFKSTKEIIKDEYISINITRNNISTLLKKRMMDSEESDDDIENCLAILNSIIND